MTRPLTVGSLCTGYGGLEMALELLFGRDMVDVRWHAETDPDASAVLKQWWDIPNLGDFTTPGFWNTMKPTDLMVGGIPCQPFSISGRRHGSHDDRFLWPAWLRGITAHRPRMVLFENVSGLNRGRMKPVFQLILNDLATAGYDVRWCELGACAIGAAHHRHRIFLLATESSAPYGDIREVPVDTCTRKGEPLIPTPAARDGGNRGTGGNAERRRTIGRYGNPGTSKQLDLPTWLQLFDVPDGDELFDWGQYAGAISGHASVTGRPAPSPIEYGPRGGRRLRAAFSEWLMMLPGGHLTSVLGRNAALTRAGNGVVPLQAATAIALLLADLNGEVTP